MTLLQWQHLPSGPRMAEEGSLFRGCTAGARAWESSPGLQGPRVRGQRETHINTCKHTHTRALRQHQGQDGGPWGQSPQGQSLRSAGPKRQVLSNLSNPHCLPTPPPPQARRLKLPDTRLQESVQNGSLSPSDPAQLCFLQKPSLTISPNWSTSCLPSP